MIIWVAIGVNLIVFYMVLFPLLFLIFLSYFNIFFLIPSLNQNENENMNLIETRQRTTGDRTLCSDSPSTVALEASGKK